MRGVGPAPEGSYRIRLHTAKRPYALTIDIRRLDKPFDRTDFDRQTTLLLGLVGNLDKVSVTSSGGSYSMTTASSSRELGYDVKELGRDRARLDAYLDAEPGLTPRRPRPPTQPAVKSTLSQPVAPSGTTSARAAVCV